MQESCTSTYSDVDKDLFSPEGIVEGQLKGFMKLVDTTSGDGDPESDDFLQEIPVELVCIERSIDGGDQEFTGHQGVDASSDWHHVLDHGVLVNGSCFIDVDGLIRILVTGRHSVWGDIDRRGRVGVIRGGCFVGGGRLMATRAGPSKV